MTKHVVFKNVKPYIYTHICVMHNTTLDTADGSSVSGPLPVGDVDILERGAGFGGLFTGIGAAGGD